VHLIYAHIAGIPVEETAVPVFSSCSVVWLAIRLFVSLRLRRRSHDEADRS